MSENSGHNVFVASHWAPDGLHSGYTIVIASSARMARLMVRDYLREKAEGYRQFHNADSLEIEAQEDSLLFANLAVPAAELTNHGVLSEHCFDGEDNLKLVYQRPTE